MHTAHCTVIYRDGKQIRAIGPTTTVDSRQATGVFPWGNSEVAGASDLMEFSCLIFSWAAELELEATRRWENRNPIYCLSYQKQQDNARSLLSTVSTSISCCLVLYFYLVLAELLQRFTRPSRVYKGVHSRLLNYNPQLYKVNQTASAPTTTTT